jgi:hypothetical protein
MNSPTQTVRHDLEHASAARRALLQPPASDLIRVGSRWWFLQTGLAGLAGLSLPDRDAYGSSEEAFRDCEAVSLDPLDSGRENLVTYRLLK